MWKLIKGFEKNVDLLIGVDNETTVAQRELAENEIEAPLSNVRKKDWQVERPLFSISSFLSWFESSS